ncbi:maleylpyruvate isomerase family mycothiol-dependent enzyme [Streptomyces monomycini]|uniref:maleylpyruvate isomerase family mycothiol-dependent enzyme n=1 Tax=Streptomyces monomycini TaxID=371720 RepID=UPI0004AAF540|nr:maleylpyruvate isomerase family mycothiol-dependent enzyme [Streptomyces monomycini]
MENTDFTESLERDGQLLADAAEKAGAAAPVPTCPEWRVRDLLSHTGRVHRWATGFVTQGLQQPVPFPEDPGLPDEQLTGWLRDGCRALVRALRSAPADLSCWTFLPAPSPLAFWTRRQAHETAVHRADAEAALGAGITACAPAFAVDGIDELLVGIQARERSTMRTELPKTLLIRAAGAVGTPGAAWTVRLSDAPPHAERIPGAAAPEDTAASGAAATDCVIEGPASDLYLALWNRRSLDGISVTGDAWLARLWQERSGV